MQSRSERSPGIIIHLKDILTLLAIVKFPQKNAQSIINVLFVAPWEAACDPRASDRRHPIGWSHHNVLHPQACECSTSEPRLISYTVLMSYICVIETGHQLDRADQPVRYPWASVSLYDRALCKCLLGCSFIDLLCLFGGCLNSFFKEECLFVD